MTLRRQIIWAALVFAAVSVLVVGVRPLVAPDEPRYGIIAAEMAESGEWCSLRMAGFHYYEKPPLGMWLMGASIKVFGESAFAIRLPSAIATGITALVVGWLVARITARRDLGVAAFLVQTTMLGPLVLGSVASLDPIFSAFVALTLGAFYGACTSLGRARVGWLVVAGIASALAFLTKGLLGFAIPALTAIGYLAWQRRWMDLLRMPGIALAAAALVVAPIAFMLHRAEPQFWEAFLFIEHFRRFASPDANQHSQPWWYLLVLFPIGALLWTLLAPRALAGFRRLVRTRAHQDGMRYCICWIALPLIALSFSKGKVPTYVLPLYAPLAVLVTIALVAAHESSRLVAGRAEQVGRWILRTLAALVLVATVVGVERFGLPALWSSHESLRLAAVAISLILWAELDAWSWRSPDAPLWLMRTATAPIAILMMIPFLFPDAYVRQSQLPWSALEANEAALVETPTLVVTAKLGHCASWATGRRDIVIVGAPSEFDNELEMPADQARIISWGELAKRIARGEKVALVASASEVTQLPKSPSLPEPSERDMRGDLAIMFWK